MNTQDIQIIQEVDELEEPQKYYTALQRLIDDGQAWNLEGFYGRNMMRAITEGYCLLGLNAHNDAYGNKVPSRLDVQEGTKGTKQFVIEKQGEDWAKLMENPNN